MLPGVFMFIRHISPALAAAGALLGSPPALAQTLVGAGEVRTDPVEVEIAFEDCLDGARAERATSYALGACDYALETGQGGARVRAALLANRAAILFRRGDAAAARVDLEQARALAPDLPEAALNLSAVLIRLEDYAGAAAEAGRALDLGLEQAWWAHFNRGVALERLGRMEAAREAYGEAARLNPDEALFSAQLERLSSTG